MKFKLGIIVFLITCVYTNIQAQQTYTLKGKVIAFKKYPVNNVKVLASKSKDKTQTDSLGNFTIEVKSKKDVVKFKADGFVGQSIRIKGEKDTTINLIYIDNESSYYNVIKDELMSEERLDYCIENLIDENNNFDRMASIFQVIQFVYPSSKVENVNGMNQIFLTSRGPNSLSSGMEALLVVDGIITEDITGISPAQVKSVEVLLGNDAAEFGSRGANGAVIIHLKNN
ncbi:carboxypeptidase-like regulatory domain-containing protein [Marinifilum sp. RC60d5]|uniref:carboxypeptidase-like regulatory domain-containing protein n=1 Tax=Marinifilum sp. RC60d5 TaxID=3458414 RepID=UPI004036CF42